MPSQSFRRWNSTAQRELDQIEATHVAIGGPAPGRRYTTQHINQAYATLLSAHFQRFCRDLHSEAIDYFSPRPPASPTMAGATPFSRSWPKAANSTPATPIRVISGPISAALARWNYGFLSLLAIPRRTVGSRIAWRISTIGEMPSPIRTSALQSSVAEPPCGWPTYARGARRAGHSLAILMLSLDSNLL